MLQSHVPFGGLIKFLAKYRHYLRVPSELLMISCSGDGRSVRDKSAHPVWQPGLPAHDLHTLSQLPRPAVRGNRPEAHLLIFCITPMTLA